ncbi:hypothetical protein C8034_v003930 [Colletotrichum sidae]|uniref:DUF6604 domain-containing protein n=1 Tax=Colletotrichum sidae TaxID=1347389 RepID=A0A4R8TNV9_9PEZI|nr:hypothetical protein C8034_v003930 [Colletotrichum sidae]
MDALQDLYDSYKESTKYALSWIWINHQPDMRDTSRNTFRDTGEILHAARLLRSREAVVPDSVLSALAKAVKDRRKALEIFRDTQTSLAKDATSDRKHGVFVNRLNEVLQILMPLRAAKMQGTALPDDFKPAASPINRFAGLSSISDDEASPSGPGPSSDAFKPNTVTEKSQVEADAQEEPEHRLEDDELGGRIELSYVVNEWDRRVEYVSDCWKQAARGSIPVAMATWMTNLTFTDTIGLLEWSIPTIAKDHAELMTKFEPHGRRGRLLRSDSFLDFVDPVGGQLAPGKDLTQDERQVHRDSDRCSCKGKYVGVDLVDRQDPSVYIQRPTRQRESGSDGLETDNVVIEDDPAKDDEVFRLLNESIRQLAHHGRGMEALEAVCCGTMMSEPMIQLIQWALEKTDEGLTMTLVFGFEVLLEAAKGFRWPDEHEENLRNPRLEALKFAGTLRDAILRSIRILSHRNAAGKVSFEHQADHLQTVVDAIDEFRRERRFDLYYQNPWTAGCHSLTLLNVAFRQGVNLVVNNGIVGCVLHLYHALRTADDEPIDAIPVFDYLCQVFKEHLFLGSFPANNYSAHFRRTRGKGWQQNQEMLSMFGGHLAMPLPTSVRHGQPDLQHLSVLHDTLVRNYSLPQHFLVSVEDGRDHRAARSRRRVRDAQSKLRGREFGKLADGVRTAVQPELDGATPIVMVDFFGVFDTCARILAYIAEFAMDFEACGFHQTGASLGFLVVDMHLFLISGALKANPCKKKVKATSSWMLLKRLFLVAVKKRELSDFLWQM